jgi:hypothetical protein
MRVAGETDNTDQPAQAAAALGDLLADRGDLPAARIRWGQAVRQYEQAGLPEADELRRCPGMLTE